MNYLRSQKYDTPELQAKIMGPNPVKLEEELLQNHLIPQNAVVCDLGSGQGVASVFWRKNTALPFMQPIFGAILRIIGVFSVRWD